MDHSDGAADPHCTYTDVAQKLIETLNGILHPECDDEPQQQPPAQRAKTVAAAAASPADLEIILDMILANLTFDDPGIFFAAPTPHRRARRMQLDFNRWLHHQIVYIVVRFPSESLRKKAAELQLEMLAASLLKQRWLFRSMVDRYARLLRDLCDGVDWSRLPHTVWPNTADAETSDVDELPPAGDDADHSAAPAPNHSHIQIAAVATRDQLAGNCIALLTQAVALCCNTDAALLERCADSVLAAYVTLDLPGKTLALQFFAKVMRRLVVPAGAAAEESDAGYSDSLLHRTVPKLLQGIQQIRGQLPVWMQQGVGGGAAAVRGKDVKRFVATLGYMLGVRELPGFCTGAYNYGVCVEMCTFLLRTSTDHQHPKDAIAAELATHFDGKFMMTVLAFFGRVVQLNRVQFDRDVWPLFATGQIGRREPDVVGLLQNCVRDQMIEEGGGGEATDGEAVWRLVDELVDGAFLVESEKETTIAEQCRRINTLATMLLAAEHAFQLHHQEHHLRHAQPSELHATCTTCQSSALADDWERIQFFHFSHQLRQTHRRLRTTMQTLCRRFLADVLLSAAAMRRLRTADALFELCDTAWRLFGNRHARTLDERQQQQLLAAAMVTLLPTGDQSRGSAAADLDQHMSVPPIGDADRLQFHEHLLQTVRSTNMHGLPKALRTELARCCAAIGADRLPAASRFDIWQHLLLQAELPLNDVLASTVDTLSATEATTAAPLFARLLPVLICTAGGRSYSVTANDTLESRLCCTQCDVDADTSETAAVATAGDCRGLIHRNRFNEWTNGGALKTLLREWLPLLFGAGATLPCRLAAVDCLPAVAVHFCEELVREAPAWLPVCADAVAEVQLRLAAVLPAVLAAVKRSTTLTAREKRTFFERLFAELGDAVEACLTPSGGCKERQAGVVGVLNAVATHVGCAEVTLLQAFVLTLWFLVRVESEVAKTAALAAFEMCARYGTTVRRMVAWHRERVFQLLCGASVANWLQYGLGLHKTLSNFCHLLGYQNLHSTFIPHYSGTLLALLLPWRQRHPDCEPLLEELCAAQNRSRPQVMASGFLQAYPYVCLRVEGEERRERCVAYLLESSGHGLVWHLKADSRRTLNEILIWYHRNPEFVMQTLRQLLAPTDAAPGTDTGATQQQLQPLSVIADYIAARFLGVLNYFGIVLVATDLEKSLQAEMLLSLGDIIRFMGAAHITPFRFKILTVLRSVMAIEQRPRLRDICAAVWKIFVYTVDVQSMGPLLSICVVFLEPLMDTHAPVVNEILKYLIIENGSLLSIHINDLFFIERTRASAEIKEFVARHARDAVGFDSRFRLLARQTAHENIDVRVYALQYLCELFGGERAALNMMIGGQPTISPLVAELLASLLVGGRHADGQLQLAAGRCLGRVGALEPSYLPPNYAPQRRLALGIHTDVFATMALAELCRAYQFQKDTKRVDGFSLAIQEILLARGVNPEQNKKLNVWNAIPERMRQLMMPLLRSCYTALPTHVQHTAHPIFSPGRFATAEAWACAWAGRLTEFVEDGDTKHLLKSFKTSLRNDAGVLSAFMPYIVLHAVQSCSAANARCIEEELHCVFRHVLTGGDGHDAEESTGGRGDELAAKCARIAFAQLEFLGSWLRQYQTMFASAKDDAYARVAALLRCFDARVVAAANFRCGEYARALQYLEVYVAEAADGRRLQEELSFLAQIYAELLDSDSLAGALNMKAEKPTLAEQVLLHTATGRLQESTVCFEQMMQLGGMPERAAVDMVQCYLGLDQPETALMVADALMRQMYDRNVPSAMYACSAEPLWRLGRFEELDELVGTAKLREAPDWGIRCGQVLLAMRTGGMAEFGAEIDRCQLSVLRELRSHDGDELGSYDKVYPLVLRLHQIAEMEMCRAAVEEVAKTAEAVGGGGGELVQTTAAVQTLKKLFEEWDARLELLQPTAKILEPVLCLRRILLSETKSLICRRVADDRPTIATTCTDLIHNYIGTSLMKSTELARTADMYQQSQLFILNAESHSPPTLFIEKAKLAWCKGDQAAALSTLERGIDELRPRLAHTAAVASTVADQRPPDTTSTVHRVFAEAKFLVATYNADSMNTNTTLNIKYFKEAMQAAGDSEKCYVFYAQYLEKVLAALSAAEQAGARGNDSQLEIMTCYGKSMSYGCRYIYQSMPRFLSIWLDFTARASPAVAAVATDAGDNQRRVAQNMTKIVDHFADVLPSFVFFTAFSQLVSRICHPSAEVYQGLKTIIIKLIKSFTQQSMWMIMSVYKSSYASRVKRCTEMFSDRRLAGRDVQKLINDFNLLAERMIELTNRPVASGEKLTVATFYRELPALLRSPGFSPIVLPTNKYMQPVLPAAEQRDRPAGAFNAFPSRAVYIADCQNELVVMPSLQKPKRITLIGDDGRDYMIMMKPKDDLRKDFRLMEFNAIVNRCLRQDAEARQRRLKIRTYAVLPLNEECGIIEWLPNLQALRPVVIELLKLKQLGVSSRELRELYRPVRDAAAKRKLLTDVLIPRHPPQLAEWYKERFSTAHNWYLARSSFVRTTAVISMAGYILGLGDRHGENILFDQSNGDTVHVDFNCLFNKGECFEVPELVPFRLTHNMVHAMGPLGVEGAYRQCSQITLRVLREQLATLMSVLRPFVYDPLVSWNRVMSKSDGRQERTDTQAITNVKRIEERLRGYVKQNGVVGTMALSSEGVVNHCIAEATDVDKLAAMYMGWGPFI